MVVKGTAVPSELDQATVADLTHYSESKSASVDDVMAQHAGIAEFAAFTTQLELDRPELYVAAGTGEGATGRWLKLTERPDSQLLASLEALPIDVTVQFGAPASSAELEELSYSLLTTLAQRPDVATSAGTSYDYQRDVLTIEYSPGPNSGEIGTEFQRAKVQAASRFGNELPVAVEIVTLPSEIVGEETVQGGRPLDRVDGRPACTAGFTARRAGSRGIVTARHCANNIRYNGVADIISVTPGVPDRGSVDAQFHRTLTENGHGTNRQFRATGTSGSDDRTVQDVANPPVGSVVCHWGRNTGYSCSSVEDARACKTYDGNTWCGLVITEDDVSADGDSGGPWFLGRDARGIHSGASSGSYSLFTRVSAITSSLAFILNGD